MKITTLEQTKRLRMLYDRAVKENKTEFKFYDTTVLVTYARYLLRYLEGRK